MKLEGVIVCVNYSDFLAHTLPHIKGIFNKLVVVTDLEDKDTKNLCEYYNVQCIQTNVFYEGKDKFNKGKGINEGLKNLDCDGWVVQLDADIYLPPLTRSILEKIELDRRTIYSIDRLMCPSFEAWQDYIRNPKQHEGWIYVHCTAFPLGVRIAAYHDDGYQPIGYFQMWNPKGSGVYEYPKEHGECDRSDILHTKKFSRSRRQLIPELVAIHLDSEGLDVYDMGKNWGGRKTRLFKKKGYKESRILKYLRSKLGKEKSN